MDTILVSEFIFKYIVKALSKIPVVNIIVAVLVFLFLLNIGIRYFILALTTTRIEDVPMDRYSIVTRWAIRKVLPRTNKYYGMSRLLMAFIGIVFITVPVIVAVVEISK